MLISQMMKLSPRKIKQLAHKQLVTRGAGLSTVFFFLHQGSLLGGETSLGGWGIG